MMKTNFLILGLVGALCLMASGCKSKSDNRPASGGVDGSGGDLSYIVDVSFEDWVKTEHTFYVRDLIHRLFLIQQNSPEDFGPGSKLASAFLSIGEAELQKLAASVQYSVASKYCSSSNHGDSDAAVTADGKICFSYLAFKNLSIESFISKLLSLTMHELSHLRNFSEADAKAWQLMFERGTLGKKTILAFNFDYRVSHKLISKVFAESVGFGQNLLSTSESLNKTACDDLAQAKAHIQDIHLYYQEYPTYISNELDSKIFYPLFGISCETNSKEVMMTKLEKVLQSINAIQQKIENYENPFCKNDLCAFRRSGSSRDSRLFLTEWQAKKESFLTGQPIEKIKVSHVICQLTDENGQNKELTMSTNSSESFVSFDLSKIDSQLGELYIKPTIIAGIVDHDKSQTYSALNIEFFHDGPINILESTGFAYDTSTVRGVILKNAEVAKVKFAIMDTSKELESNPSKKGEGLNLPYYLSEPTIKSFNFDPQQLRTYELECRLN